MPTVKLAQRREESETGVSPGHHHCKVFVMEIVKKLEEKNSGVKEGDQ